MGTTGRGAVNVDIGYLVTMNHSAPDWTRGNSSVAAIRRVGRVERDPPHAPGGSRSTRPTLLTRSGRAPALRSLPDGLRRTATKFTGRLAPYRFTNTSR